MSWPPPAASKCGASSCFCSALAVAVCFWRLARGTIFADAYHALRADLGRAILLGLEMLVVADLIGTVAIDPNLQNLSVLALIVVIRTALSFALELEVSGRWPWQRAQFVDQKTAP